mmetsp:Transcript_66818/g.120274  ORF Transcript_66818/g.120274 Transcript_66818/m.120274 type:complete len:1040 (-) Transcript_66818:72-3191(-)
MAAVTIPSMDSDSGDYMLTLSDMLWSSLSEAIWFAAGFLVFRFLIYLGVVPSWSAFGWGGGLGRGQIKADANSNSRRSVAGKAICADGDAGNFSSVREAWSREKSSDSPLPVDALQVVAQALLDEPLMADELMDYLGRHSSLARPSTLQALMETLLQFGRPELAEQLLAAASEAKLHLGQDSLKLRAQLLERGFAAQGHADKVQELLEHWASQSREASLEPCLKGPGGEDTAGSQGPAEVLAVSAVRGFLKGGHSELALQQLLAMQQQGLHPPSSALVAFARGACSKNKSLPQALESLKSIALPMDAAAVVMLECLAREDLPSALTLEQRLRGGPELLSYPVYEPLLKLVAKFDESHALKLFQEMQDQGLFLSEGFCGLVLSFCGDARHVKLADEVQQYLKSRKMTTLATYKTLMKVYAYSNLFNRACGLYNEILADGIEPDQVMYGCLVKFAVKCGCEELSERLFDKAQGGDVQNYMWLIRSAGRKGDVHRAVALLRKLQSAKGQAPDTTIYNCVLDVCMTNGAMDLAQEIVEEMRQLQLLSLVTYNTLLKGHAARGDFPKAKQLLNEIHQVGLAPDSASFNCLISAAVSASRFDEVWVVFDEMQRKGVLPDHFTISILMKVVRKSANHADARRALAVLDQSRINLCEDEVLLNSVLDACIHHKDTKRLPMVLADFEKSALKPSIQNYGLVIKAYACLKNTRKCWSVWQEMTASRGLIPSDVALSCMLDALVSSGQVEDAVSLFQEWRSKVPLNTIIFSTLIKGFAARGDAERAMEMHRDLEAQGLQMNLLAYSTLIDVHARAGNLEKAEALMNRMEKDGIRPNTITYSSMVKGHCLKGDLDRALQTFDKMLSASLKADTVIYNTLLDGAVKCSRFNLCDQLLKDMSGYGVEPSNFTLSIMVKMWGKRRNLNAAFDAVRTALGDSRQRLDSQICTCLMSACFYNNDPRRALEALKEMKTWPNCDGPDGSTYGTLVSGLTRAHCFKEAVAAALEAAELSSGPRPSIKALSSEVLRQLRKELESRKRQDLWELLASKQRA